MKSEQTKVLISIVDIKYGNSHLMSPKIITIYDDKKFELEVPFTEKLEYSFQNNNEEMIFKFAILSDN